MLTKNIKGTILLFLVFLLIFNSITVTHAKTSYNCDISLESLQEMSFKNLKTYQKECKNKISYQFRHEMYLLMTINYEKLAKKYNKSKYESKYKLYIDNAKKYSDYAKKYENYLNIINKKLADYKYLCNFNDENKQKTCMQKLDVCLKENKKSSIENCISQYKKKKYFTSENKPDEISDNEKCIKDYIFKNGKCVSLKQKESCTWPESNKKIAIDSYQKLTIDTEIPTIFKLGETYVIRGKLSDTNEKYATAFYSEENNVIDSYIVETVSGYFEIPVTFNNVGNFNFSIIPGQNGVGFAFPISVRNPYCEKIFNKEIFGNVEQINWKLENNHTYFEWDSPGNLTRFTIKQGDNYVQKIFSNNIKQWEVDYKDFKNLKEGTATLGIEAAESKDGSALMQETNWTEIKQKNITIINHNYSLQDDDKIFINGYNNVFKNNEKITITGKILSETNLKAYVTLPDGQVEDVNIVVPEDKTYKNKLSFETVIKPNTDFLFEYQPKKNGTHIIEINGSNGIALFNKPVYQNGYIPLIPDFYDLEYFYNTQMEEGSLSSIRSKMLNYVNSDRKNHNSKEIILDSKLNEIAQARVTDMILNNYYGHFNSQGKGANDIRSEFGVVTYVSENISQTRTSNLAELGLMRSGGHRKNIINPKWTRIGIGVLKKDDNSSIYVQIFSDDELNEKDFIKIQDDIFNNANNKRQKDLNIYNKLEVIADDWASTLSEYKTNNFDDVPERNLIRDLRDNKIYAKAIALSIGVSNIEILKEQINESIELYEENWNNIGIGVNQGKDGMIRIIILLSE